MARWELKRYRWYGHEDGISDRSSYAGFWTVCHWRVLPVLLVVVPDELSKRINQEDGQREATQNHGDGAGGT